MDELGLVRRIRSLAKGSGSDVVLGIGDDAAIFRPRPGEDLVFTTDLLVEDVHFRRDTHPPDAVGHKALARGLSDVAAMGAEPRFCLLSLALAPCCDRKWVYAFYRGLLRLARKTGTPLIGGDLAHAEKITCDIVVCGAVPKGKALRRDGAQPGDLLYVTGTLGGSALGLSLREGPAYKRHLRPQARLEAGRVIRERIKASAGMDLSDGLSIDLHRLCEASGVAAEIDQPLPIFPGATLDQALHGGEDYELLFTASPKSAVPSKIGSLPVTRIGRIVKGKARSVKLYGKPLLPLGYDHFRRT